MPYKRKGSPVWQVKINGVRRSTGTTDEETAKRIEKEWREPTDPYLHSWARVIEEYLEAVPYPRAEWSARAMYPYFKNLHIETITGQDIAAYKKARGVSDATIRKELGTLRAAIRRFNKENGTSLQDVTQGRMPKKPPGRLRWLSHSEYKALLAAAHKSKAYYLADAITLAVNTGMRRGEILGLEWSRVDLENRLIYLSPDHQKSKRFSSIPINNNALTVFSVLEASKTGSFVINNNGKQIASIKKSFNSAVSNAGLVDFHFHDLRHTCAAWLVQAGVPIRTVAEILRHSDITATMLYAHLSPDNAREGIAALDAI